MIPKPAKLGCLLGRTVFTLEWNIFESQYQRKCVCPPCDVSPFSIPNVEHSRSGHRRCISSKLHQAVLLVMWRMMRVAVQSCEPINRAHADVAAAAAPTPNLNINCCRQYLLLKYLCFYTNLISNKRWLRCTLHVLERPFSIRPGLRLYADFWRSEPLSLRSPSLSIYFVCIERVLIGCVLSVRHKRRIKNFL